MKKIASFTIDHDVLTKGMYTSRIDGDAVTYDVRMKVPNSNDYLEDNALHTLEHLMATYIRNTEFSDNVIYVGPMGCRTGFYVIFRDSINPEQAIKLVRDSLKFSADFEGEIPGSTKKECGNYLAHDLQGAKLVAKDMVGVLENWSVEKLVYPKGN